MFGSSNNSERPRKRIWIPRNRIAYTYQSHRQSPAGSPSQPPYQILSAAPPGTNPGNPLAPTVPFSFSSGTYANAPQTYLPFHQSYPFSPPSQTGTHFGENSFAYPPTNTRMNYSQQPLTQFTPTSIPPQLNLPNASNSAQVLSEGIKNNGYSRWSWVRPNDWIDGQNAYLIGHGRYGVVWKVIPHFFKLTARLEILRQIRF